MSLNRRVFAKRAIRREDISVWQGKMGTQLREHELREILIYPFTRGNIEMFGSKSNGKQWVKVDFGKERYYTVPDDLLECVPVDDGRLMLFTWADYEAGGGPYDFKGYVKDLEEAKKITDGQMWAEEACIATFNGEYFKILWDKSHKKEWTSHE